MLSSGKLGPGLKKRIIFCPLCFLFYTRPAKRGENAWGMTPQIVQKAYDHRSERLEIGQQRGAGDGPYLGA
jgi:hypothetical protein